MSHWQSFASSLAPRQESTTAGHAARQPSQHRTSHAGRTANSSLNSYGGGLSSSHTTGHEPSYLTNQPAATASNRNMYPPVLPAPASTQPVPLPKAPAQRRDAHGRASSIIPGSLPASIPLPSARNAGPRLPQVTVGQYGTERPAGRQHCQKPARHADYGSSISSILLGGLLGSALSMSPSPPHNGSPCACCPQPYAYPPHVPYLELPEPALGRMAPMSMPMPMPDTRGYTPASMPSYGLSIPQKPRKHVTFANPIAEYRLVPSTASSAPERSHAVLEGPPVAGGRRRRDSISLHHDRRQGLAGSYGSHSMVASGGHGLASVADYSGHPALFNGYTVHPASNSSAMASGHKRRASGNRQAYGADTTKPPVLRGNDTRKSHIATSAVSHRHAPPCQPRLYDVFSLSSEHLPLYA